MSDASAPNFAGENGGIRYATLPLNHVGPRASQVRKHFDDAALDELADSIRINGVIQPIVVRSAAAGPDGQQDIVPYDIIAGERRWRASCRAGLQSIPCVIRDDLSDAEVETLQVLENLQRQDLQLGEVAAGIAKLVEHLGHEKTCAQLGKSPAWVSKHARLGSLPAPVLALVHEGLLDSADMAQELGTLHEIAPDKACVMIGRFRGEPDDDDQYPEDESTDSDDAPEDQCIVARPTRVELRNELHLARIRANEKARLAAARKEQREAEAAAPHAAERKADEARAAKEQRAPKQLVEQMQKDAPEFARAKQRDIVHLALNRHIDAADMTAHRDLPIGIQTEWINAYSAPSAKTVKGLNYDVSIDGDARTVAPILNMLCPGQHVTASLNNVPIAIAQQIETLLGREVKWRHAMRLTGNQIDKLIAAEIQRQHTSLGRAADGPPSEDPNGSEIVQSFIAACIQRQQGAKLKASDAYEAYVTWCKHMGNQPLALNDNAYGAAWASLGINKVRSNGIRYVGVTLKE